MTKHTFNVTVCFALLFSVCGCASKGTLRPSSVTARGDYMRLDDFCSRERAVYDFDTVDDIVRITSESMDLKLLLGVAAASLNGSFIELQHAPFYSKGVIYVPSQLCESAAKGNILRATLRRSESCSASYTTPIPPLPICRMIRKSPSARLGRISQRDGSTC